MAQGKFDASAALNALRAEARPPGSVQGKRGGAAQARLTKKAAKRAHARARGMASQRAQSAQHWSNALFVIAIAILPCAFVRRIGLVIIRKVTCASVASDDADCMCYSNSDGQAVETSCVPPEAYRVRSQCCITFSPETDASRDRHVR